MKSTRFHDSKLNLVKALLFRSFLETEASTTFYCFTFIVLPSECKIWGWTRVRAFNSDTELASIISGADVN